MAESACEKVVLVYNKTVKRISFIVSVDFVQRR